MAEVTGGGASYLKVEIIRVNALVIPLHLDAAEPNLAGAALALTLLKAFGKFTKHRRLLLQRSLRFVFTSCDQALEVFLQRRKPLGYEVFSAMELDLKIGNSAQAATPLQIDSSFFGQRAFVAEALLEYLGKERTLTVEEHRGDVSSLTLPPLGIPYARLSGRLAEPGRKSAAQLEVLRRPLAKSLVLLADTDYDNSRAFVRPRLRRAAQAMRANPADAHRIYHNLICMLRGVSVSEIMSSFNLAM